MGALCENKKMQLLQLLSINIQTDTAGAAHDTIRHWVAEVSRTMDFLGIEFDPWEWAALGCQEMASKFGIGPIRGKAKKQIGLIAKTNSLWDS